MQEYRLSRWPVLPTDYDRTVYRKLLHGMSHQFVTEKQLANMGGLPRGQLQPFLSYLKRQGVLQERSSLFEIEQSDSLPLRLHLRAWSDRLRRRAQSNAWVMVTVGAVIGVGIGAIASWL